MENIRTNFNLLFRKLSNKSFFQNYTRLIHLSFARNSIHTIEFFSFETFEQLNYLDLSDNRLEDIENKLFESNHNLKTVDFSKNKFMSLSNQPLIISKSIEVSNFVFFTRFFLLKLSISDINFKELAYFTYL